MFCTNCGVALYEGAAVLFCVWPVRERRDAADDRPGRWLTPAFWQRALAAVIDALVLVIPSMAVVVFAVAFLGLEPPAPDAPIDAVAADARVSAHGGDHSDG